MNNLTQQDIDVIKMIVADKIKSLEIRLDRTFYKIANDKAWREDIEKEIEITKKAYEKLKMLNNLP